ncbi:alpha/beta family hydrolase [Ferruginivarius sediminum]|uniref:Alpha/beta hydrolase n=1 Tax=Ferruginivarius sediminum TaxID=2661937 RepID=A0A369TB80_9PROT|nr:alpha/beta family hydrolase [Ferruginivarius sediminum]RDD62530.1 alpha/beta hydrolase [Ferruginivarius sediminum]
MSETPEILFDGPAHAERTVAMAHGAGVGMDSPFMQAFAEGLAGHGIRVARFEFPYMAQRRQDGKKRPPNPEAKLKAYWRVVIEALGGPDGLVIGGKSMGGRMASMIAADLEAEATPVGGLVCLGYPFHPPGKPDRLRVAHLQTLVTPALIVQGTRDPFGTPDEVAGYGLPESIAVHWAEDGDHDLKPRKSSGRSAEENQAEAIAAVARFVEAL